MNCDTCGKTIVHDGFGTGYGIDKDNNKVCYDCCALQDKKGMLETGKAVLYLDKAMVSNWPGTLKIHVYHSKKGKHNIAGTRIDVWFKFEGQSWHGVNYGNNSQLLYCKRVKGF